MQQGEYGGSMNFTSGLDLSGATAIVLNLHPPRGAPIISRNLDQSAAIGDKKLGIVQYVIQEGDLDAAGTYYVQIEDHTGGRVLKSKVGKFLVLPNE